MSSCTWERQIISMCHVKLAHGQKSEHLAKLWHRLPLPCSVEPCATHTDAFLTNQMCGIWCGVQIMKLSNLTSTFTSHSHQYAVPEHHPYKTKSVPSMRRQIWHLMEFMTKQLTQSTRLTSQQKKRSYFRKKQGLKKIPIRHTWSFSNIWVKPLTQNHLFTLHALLQLDRYQNNNASCTHGFTDPSQ
jgi:hypothetical protein